MPVTPPWFNPSVAGEGLDRRIAEIAAEQLGLFSTGQAIAAGATERVVRTRLHTGRWETVQPRVLRLAGAPVTSHQELLAACMATSATAVASHRAAARLWGLPGFDSGMPEVTVTRHRWHRLRGVRCHETLELPASDVTRCASIPVTTPTRTLIDVARYAPVPHLEEAVDDALRRGLTTVDRLTARVDDLAAHGRRGIARIRTVLEPRNPAAAVPESVQERRLVRLLQRHGLPSPMLQFEIHDGNRFVARVDAAYPDRRIAIEYDSYMYHGGRRRHEVDLARRNRLEGLGWRVFHATAADLRTGGDSRLCTDIARFLRGFSSVNDGNPRKNDGVAS
jgi:hypothetical protein